MELSPQHITETVEVLSDVLGTVSALFLVAPAYKVLARRKKIKEARDAFEMLQKTQSKRENESIDQYLVEHDHIAQEFESVDLTQLRLGALLLLAAFVLRLIYHIFSKTDLLVYLLGNQGVS